MFLTKADFDKSGHEHSRKLLFEQVASDETGFSALTALF
jgi:hypothetical protein